MTDPDFILATAHLIESAARRPGAHASTRKWAAYARRRVREILAERATERGEEPCSM